MSSNAGAAATFGCSSFRRWTRDPCQLIRLASWRVASPASAPRRLAISRSLWREPCSAQRRRQGKTADREKLAIALEAVLTRSGKRLDRASPSLGN